jgi:adenine deaminase
MMNYPGLLGGDPDIMEKLQDFAARPRDGHCPGLTGKDLNAYGVAGIHTCHESTTLAEAREKLSKGIHTLIREGSCAKNAETLLPLLTDYTSSVLGFCSDDRNPLDIETEGHIDRIINLALKGGHGPAAVFRAASYGAARMYQLLDRGAIAPGYRADLVCLTPKAPQKGGQTDWTSGVQIQKVLKGGQWIPQNSLASPLTKVLKPSTAKTNLKVHSQFRGESLKDFLGILAPVEAPPGSTVPVRVIGVIPQQIVTRSLTKTLLVSGAHTLEADLSQDVLKIMVIERHRHTKSRGMGLVHGFGLKRGAIATSINHDSHNALLVGSSDQLMLAAW